MTWAGNRADRRSGQAIIFLVMVIIILTFVVLWNFDLHKVLFVKSRSQNAGDAAALMAARWQAITLNLIGDLNIMHALALSADDSDAVASISNVQARLCYVGPMVAMMAAQQAAKNNGIYVHPGFSALLSEHARAVREEYPEQSSEDGEMLFPQPYQGCWEEYADMLDLIANEGVAAGPDNASFYTDFVGGHYLLMIDFYEAIAGRNWCWFYRLGATGLLEDYEDFFPCWWSPLPEPVNRYYMNSEIFGLGLSKSVTALQDHIDQDTVNALAAARGLGTAISNSAMAMASVWYTFGNSWTAWDAMATDASATDPFPATGPVREQYDYAGADAAIRVEATADLLSPGHRGAEQSRTITWTAAAKPFGYLNEDERPNAYGIVLPAFHDVRLIPVDASSAPSGGSFNLAWRRHIEDHLPEYMTGGPDYITGDPDASDCWYCQQLLTWEDESFRQEGVDWLEENYERCIIPTGPGGPRRGGGRRRGH